MSGFKYKLTLGAVVYGRRSGACEVTVTLYARQPGAGQWCGEYHPVGGCVVDAKLFNQPGVPGSTVLSIVRGVLEQCHDHAAVVPVTESKFIITHCVRTVLQRLARRPARAATQFNGNISECEEVALCHYQN